MMKKIICILVLVALVAGCTVSSYEKYTQATITGKFDKSEPMPFVNPETVDNPAWYNHDYYIQYTTGGAPRVDLVSKDVYNSVFEGHTYVLKAGYVDEFGSANPDHGYIEVIQEVNTT